MRTLDHTHATAQHTQPMHSGNEYGTFYYDRLMCPELDDFFKDRFNQSDFHGKPSPDRKNVAFSPTFAGTYSTLRPPTLRICLACVCVGAHYIVLRFVKP